MGRMGFKALIEEGAIAPSFLFQVSFPISKGLEYV